MIKIYSRKFPVLVCVFSALLPVLLFTVNRPGFIGLTAIGFFAVWSILSNILAGIILFFVTLTGDGGDEYNIPSNVLMRKIVKRIGTKSRV